MKKKMASKKLKKQRARKPRTNAQDSVLRNEILKRENALLTSRYDELFCELQGLMEDYNYLWEKNRLTSHALHNLIHTWASCCVRNELWLLEKGDLREWLGKLLGMKKVEVSHVVVDVQDEKFVDNKIGRIRYLKLPSSLAKSLLAEFPELQLKAGIHSTGGYYLPDSCDVEKKLVKFKRRSEVSTTSGEEA